MKLFSTKKKEEEKKVTDTDAKLDSDKNPKDTPSNKQDLGKQETATEQPKVDTKDRVLVSAAEQQATVQLDKESDGNEIKKIMEILSNSKENSINPFINFEENIVSYPLLSQLGSKEYVESVLENLSSPSVNVLDKKIYERLPVCPEHPQYFATTLRLYCSACSSTDIVKLHLIEHKVCGYITEKKDFGTVSDMTKCISCKNTIKDPQKEIRRLGRWYECNNCKARFDNCVIKLNCRKFSHDFDINQANIIAIPCYNLKSEMGSSQYYSVYLIPQIRKDLESRGFTVEESSTIKGKSGIAHKSSLFARNSQNKTLLVDIKSSENMVEDAEVNSMIMKVLDVSPTLSIFVGIPSVSESVKTMASTNNIAVITGKNPTEILSAVDVVLKTRLYAGLGA